MLAVGVMNAGTLTGNYVIPRRDQRHKSGYQREASISRVNKLIQQLSLNRVDLPTAVLLNMREFDTDQHLVEENGQLFSDAERSAAIRRRWPAPHRGAGQARGL